MDRLQAPCFLSYRRHRAELKTGRGPGIKDKPSFAEEDDREECVPSCWDKAEALGRMAGDRELLEELCRIFLEESPAVMGKLRQGVVEGEAEAVQRAAHSLKGEASCLAAAKVSQLARQLEEMGQDHNLAKAAQTLQSLEREVADLQDALRTSNGAV
jgi:HPt (histidine-containing phosphotransfer) domain-containing protein